MMPTQGKNLVCLPCAVAIALFFIIAWLLFCAIVIDARMGFAHDALPSGAQPQGWTYPFACCSGYDCREVPKSAIGEGKAGYTIRATGELIAMSDSRIKPSPDGEFHWCSVAGADDGRTICLFVPPRGF